MDKEIQLAYMNNRLDQIENRLQYIEEILKIRDEPFVPIDVYAPQIQEYIRWLVCH